MEALAVALAGYTSLSEAANGSIRPVDRLHALGMGQRYREAQREAALICLGGDLIRYSRSRVDSAQGDCVEKLANLLKGREETRMAVAIQAIHEFHAPACQICKGRTDATGIFSVPAPQEGWKEGDGPVPMRVCPSCNGTGVKKWGRKERTDSLGFDSRKVEALLSEAHFLISHATWLSDQYGTREVNRW